MQKIESKLTVCFEDPFWVGVYERTYDDKLEVCKITFGAEPKDYYVYDFLLKNWTDFEFSSAFENKDKAKEIKNPKRLKRAIKKQVSHSGVGTKAQQAIKVQQFENKIKRRKRSRIKSEEEKERQFELKQQKKKEKKLGH